MTAPVRVEVGTLAVHGLGRREAERAAAAFSAELERLLATRGLRPAEPGPPPGAGASPGEIGRAAARAAHARIAS